MLGEVTCAHCRQSVPAGLVEPAAAEQFCCRGCRSAYELIHSCGLAQFYALRDQDVAEAIPAPVTEHSYGEYDDAAFQSRHCAALPNGLQSIELYLEGVHCAACVWLVEKLPNLLAGVAEVRLQLRRSLVRIAWSPEQIELSEIVRTLDRLGYPPHPAANCEHRKQRYREDRRALIRMAVAGACAGNVMLVSLALYAGDFEGMAADHRQLFRWLSMGIGLVSLAWPGRVFFRGAWAAWRTRTPHLDLPIALGLATGGVAGTISTVLNRGEIYFDSLCVLIFMLLVGRWLQQQQQRRTNDAIDMLFSLTPTACRRIENNGVRTVPVEALAVGDRIEVRAGDCLPADGQIVAGDSLLDQAILTGESQPRRIAIGDDVCAGAVNLTSPLQVRVTAAGAETRLGQLLHLVAESSARKGPLVQLADRIGGYFVGTVTLLAALTFTGWAFSDLGAAVNHAVALLIVACPCALGLATPLATAVAIGRAASRRIMIRGGDTLERLAGGGLVLLDKTGTVTMGRIGLQHWAGAAELLPLAAAVEAHSQHPIARAIVNSCAAAVAPATDITQAAGGGIAGTVAGRQVVVGSPTFLRDRGETLPSWLAAEAETAAAAGLTPVVISADGLPAALAACCDRVRPEAARAVRALRAAGWRVGMLSGDDPQVAAQVGKHLGIAADLTHGGMTPEAKAAFVATQAAQQTVIMIGDGVNDAAALASASVGIAVQGGAEVSLAAADVYLDRPGLDGIIELLDAARRTVRVMRRNLVAGLIYNAVAVGLAAAGLISPLLAAVLMPLSSLTVVSLTLAARTFPPAGQAAKAAVTGTAPPPEVSPWPLST